MSSKHPTTEKSDKSKQPKLSRFKPSFVSENAKYKHLVICKKNVISNRPIMLANFEHVNPANIWRSNSLEYFVTIR